MVRAALQGLVSELVASGDATAAAAVVGRGGRRLAMARAGHRDLAGRKPLRRWDRFDLASLTKPWMATLAVRLALRGDVPLGLPLGEVWPGARGPLAEVALEALLRHRSGLQAWRPLPRQVREPGRAAAFLLRPDVAGAPVPTYSDLGYVLWTRSVERLTGEPAVELLRRHVLRPLGLSSVDVVVPAGRAVACGLSNAREVELAAALGVRLEPQGAIRAGWPQDGNARFLGSLPGHAGLFATPEAVWRLGVAWLRPGALLPEVAVDAALAGAGAYRLGWWRREASPTATAPLGRRSFGHRGFTGGSVWIDPRAELVAVVLAHRREVATDLEPWRRRFHALALELAAEGRGRKTGPRRPAARP